MKIHQHHHELSYCSAWGHRSFMSGVRRWYWCHSPPKNTQWKSVGVTCSVMSDRSLFTLLAISRASPDPWSIEFLYTWCTTPMEDSEAHTFSSTTEWRLHTDTHARTHTLRPKVDSILKSEEVQYWHVMTNTGTVKYTAHTQRETYGVKYLSTGSEWNSKRRGILTAARSPEKVEQKVEGSE